MASLIHTFRRLVGNPPTHPTVGPVSADVRTMRAAYGGR